MGVRFPSPASTQNGHSSASGPQPYIATATTTAISGSQPARPPISAASPLISRPSWTVASFSPPGYQAWLLPQCGQLTEVETSALNA
jgi:hypothetical protein